MFKFDISRANDMEGLGAPEDPVGAAPEGDYAPPADRILHANGLQFDYYKKISCGRCGWSAEGGGVVRARGRLWAGAGWRESRGQEMLAL